MAGYGILRIEKIKMSAGGELFSRARHNCRQYPPGKEPENIDPNRTKHNQIFGAVSITDVQKRAKDLWEKTTGTPRSDAVGVLEAMITFSGESLSPENTTEYLKASKTFLEGLYGPEKVIGVYVHLDEKTPHLHAFIVPLEEKKVKKKQTVEEKTTGVFRTELQVVLNAHKITGGKKCLQDLQNKFYAEVSGRFSLERGEPASETQARHRRPSIREEEKNLKQEKININSALKAINEQKEELDQKKFILEKEKRAVEQQKFNLSEQITQERREIESIKKDFEAKKTRYEVLRQEFDRLMTIPLEKLKLSQPIRGESSQEYLEKNDKELIALYQRAQRAETKEISGPNTPGKPTQTRKNTSYNSCGR
jgi:hypothetical protein